MRHQSEILLAKDTILYQTASIVIIADTVGTFAFRALTLHNESDLTFVECTWAPV